MIKTFRFNEYVNGWTKLELRDGQQINWHNFGYHDEGWSSTGITFKREGNFIFCNIETQCQCCDGRTGTSANYYAHILAPKISKPNADNCIDWKEQSASQYDQFAEMAGY